VRIGQPAWVLAASAPAWVNAVFVIAYVIQAVVLYRLTRRRVGRQLFTVGIVAATTVGLALLTAGVAATELGLVVSGLVLLGAVAYGWVHRADKLRP
jgi:hypothetical protein